MVGGIGKIWGSIGLEGKNEWFFFGYSKFEMFIECLSNEVNGLFYMYLEFCGVRVGDIN